MNSYLKVLYEIYTKPRNLQSDFARYNAQLVAEAASRGHISCIIAGVATNKWYITIGGAEFLKKAGWIE